MAFTTNGVIATKRIGRPTCFSQLVQNVYMISSFVMSLCLIYVRGLATLRSQRKFTFISVLESNESSIQISFARKKKVKKG